MPALGNIEVQVACEYRAQHYWELIKEVYNSLQYYYNEKLLKKYDASFVLASIHDPMLYEALAEELDHFIILCINKVIEDKQNGLEAGWYPLANDKEQARNTLIAYYKSQDFQMLLDNDLKLHRVLHARANNFRRNIEKVLERVLKHYQLLAKYFLHQEHNKVHLQKIEMTGSDPHRGGQQVLILNFANKDTHKQVGRIVYKPSSVLTAAYVAGNSMLLNQGENPLLHNFEGKSLFELCNDLLEENDPKLATYLIYPCEASVWNESYGFIEYLSHEPWPSLDKKKEVRDILTAIPPAKRYQTKYLKTMLRNKLKLQYPDIKQEEIIRVLDINDYIEVMFTEELKKEYTKIKAQGQTSDFILEDEEAMVKYGRTCGMLTAIARTFGMSDWHVQNLIAHLGVLVPIDLETVFQNNLNLAKEIGCFDSDFGAMRSRGHFQERIDLLVDSEGLLRTSLQAVEKNRIYQINEDGDLIPREPYQDHFMWGFEKIMNLLHYENQSFQDWFNRDVIQQLWIRKLPLNTNSLMINKEKFFESTYDGEEFCRKIYSNRLREWLNRIDEKGEILQNKNINEKIIQDQLFEDPVFSVCQQAHQLNDLRAGDIPFFCSRCDERELYDSHGNIINLPYEDIGSEPGLTEQQRLYLEKFELINNTSKYSLKSDWEVIFAKLKELQHESKKMAIVNQVAHEMQTVLPENQNYSQFNPGCQLQ